jgi:hypothetical protein
MKYISIRKFEFRFFFLLLKKLKHGHTEGDFAKGTIYLREIKNCFLFYIRAL